MLETLFKITTKHTLRMHFGVILGRVKSIAWWLEALRYKNYEFGKVSRVAFRDLENHSKWFLDLTFGRCFFQK